MSSLTTTSGLESEIHKTFHVEFEKQPAKNLVYRIKTQDLVIVDGETIDVMSNSTDRLSFDINFDGKRLQLE